MKIIEFLESLEFGIEEYGYLCKCLERIHYIQKKHYCISINRIAEMISDDCHCEYKGELYGYGKDDLDFLELKYHTISNTGCPNEIKLYLKFTKMPYLLVKYEEP